jgi:hypothetical protein
MKDSLVTLCIPSYNLSHGSPVVFKNDHIPEFCRDNEHCIVDILLATSAAPTYFPVHSFESMAGDSFVDGGLWANNPSLIGVVEAVRFYLKPNGEYDRYELLSIGSVETPFGFDPDNPNMSVSKWMSKTRLIESFMSAQAKSIEFTIQHLNSLLPGYCYRIKSPPLTPEQIDLVELDMATTKSLRLLESLGSHVGNMEGVKPEVLKFFGRGGLNGELS